MTDDLMGTAEIAALLQISRQRVSQLTSSEGFPAPTARLAAGQIWRRDEIEAWARENGRLK